MLYTCEADVLEVDPLRRTSEQVAVARQTDHITLVVATSGSGPLVAVHNTDMYNYPWNFGSINYATFSHVY